MFGQMKDMYKLQQQAKKMKKELENVHVFAEEDGVKVTVSGEQKIVKYEILDESILSDAKRLEKALLTATNRAMTKAQQIAAEKMQEIMGGLGGLPGLGGN